MRNEKEPYFQLAVGVVTQAINDYIDALETTLYSRRYNDIIEAKAEILRIENFFATSFIVECVFDTINPRDFIKQLKYTVLTGGDYKKLYTI